MQKSHKATYVYERILWLLTMSLCLQTSDNIPTVNTTNGVQTRWYCKAFKLQRRHEQVSSEYAGGDLIGFLEDHNIVNYSNQAWNEQKMCQ